MCRSERMSYSYLTVMSVYWWLCLARLLATVSASFTDHCPVPTLPNGRIKVRSGGLIITYKCKRRFSLISEYADALCIDNEWFPSTNPVCIRRGCPSLESPSDGYRIYQHRQAMASFFCNPGHELDGSSVLICDGTNWNGTAPQCQMPAHEQSPDCSFTENTCKWEQPVIEETFWVHSSEANATVGTGPELATNGPYLVVDSSGIELVSKAELYSPLIHPEKDLACLSFSFNMHGITMGALRVFQVPDGLLNTTGLEPLLEIRGNQGLSWYQQTVMLPKVNYLYNVILQAEVGQGYLGDIAIDEIQFQSDDAFCRNALQYNVQPLAPIVVPNPVSCNLRCEIPITNVSSSPQWTEGICSCQKACVLNRQDQDYLECCSDYVDECHSHWGPSDFRSLFPRELGLSWNVVAVVVVGVVGIVALLAFTGLWCHSMRARVVPPKCAQSQLEDDSDLRFMVHEEEDQEIDFRLATPSTLNFNLDPLPISIRNRTITSI